MNLLISNFIQQNQYLTIGFVVLASVFFIIKYISIASDATNSLSLRKINKLKALNFQDLPKSKLQNFITQAYDEEVFRLLTSIETDRKTVKKLVELYESDLMSLKELKLVGRFLQEKDDKLLIQYGSFEKFQAAYSQILFIVTGIICLYLIVSIWFSTNFITAIILMPITALAFYFTGEWVIKDFTRYKVLHQILPRLSEEQAIHSDSDSIDVKFINFMRKPLRFKRFSP